MAIRIVNRSLDIPISERNIGHTGDNLVEVRIFELNRYYSNIDLSEFDFKLDTQVGDIKNIIDLDKAISGDKIVLTWLIKESHLTAPGRMDIQIRAFKDSEEKWHSAQDYVKVQPSINAEQSIPDPLPSEFVQMEQRVTVAKNAAEEAAQMATEQAGIVQQIVERAEIDVLPALNQSIEDAGQAKDLLDGSIEAAGTAKSNLDGSISAAGEAKTDLDGVITQAGTVKGQLDGSITQAGTKKTELDGSITVAGQVKSALDESIANGDLAAFKAEFESHKNDYASYQDSNNLKIATVEKNLNDYKATIAGMNPNQEPKQKVNGYGIIPLPKNAAPAPLRATLRGVTAMNLVQNGNFANGTSGWIKHEGISFAIDNNEAITTVLTSGSSLHIRCPLSNIANHAYYISFTIKPFRTHNPNAYIGAQVITMPQLAQAGVYTRVSSIVTTAAAGGFFYLYVNGSVSTQDTYIGSQTTFKDIVVVDLTSHGLDYLTLEQCDALFSGYFDSTQSAIAPRLRSVDKNGENPTYLYIEPLFLRGLPNNVCDELTPNKYTQNVKEYVLRASDIAQVGNLTNVSYVLIAKPTDAKTYGNTTSYATDANVYLEGFTPSAFADDATKTYIMYNSTTTAIGLIVPKGIYANLTEARAALTGKRLYYQLATPITFSVDVSGTLTAYPSGTIYAEPALADAGIYDGGITVLRSDFPIETLETVERVDFATGRRTPLDVSDAVISPDGKSFTHPDLIDGDIVFFTYYYAVEGIQPEIDVEYYDSRYVIKDSVTEKFYKWHIAVAEGVPSIELVEV